MILKARYVVPVSSPPIKNGAVAVREGRIEAVGSARELDHETAVDYGDAVICPAFVNAHTHLELTLLADAVPPAPDFIDWLGRLVAAKSYGRAKRKTVQRAVTVGAGQSTAAGVTLVADITRHPAWTREVLAGQRLRCVSFGEVIAIGTRRSQLAERLEAACDARHTSARLRIGVSPHAPYTVEPDAMRACTDRAKKMTLPMCIHLAETRDEQAFTELGTGPFADYMKKLGVWDERIPVSGCGPVELVDACGLLTPRTVLAHANYVSDDDITLISRSRASVAWCPRTHHAFGHAPHRFRDLQAAGINVCVGTDSLASNPSLSVLDELRFVRAHHPDVPPNTLLAMGTLCGARALGFTDTLGSLEPGKTADVAVIPLDPSVPMDRWEPILESALQPLAVHIDGHRLRLRP